MKPSNRFNPTVLCSARNILWMSAALLVVVTCLNGCDKIKAKMSGSTSKMGQKMDDAMIHAQFMACSDTDRAKSAKNSYYRDVQINECMSKKGNIGFDAKAYRKTIN